SSCSTGSRTAPSKSDRSAESGKVFTDAANMPLLYHGGVLGRPFTAYCHPSSVPAIPSGLSWHGIAALRGRQVEVDGGQVGDQELRRGQSPQGAQHLHVAAARLAGRGPAARLLALRVEVAEPLVVAVVAERAAQAGELPFRGAQAAAQEARLLQAAELA